MICSICGEKTASSILKVCAGCIRKDIKGVREYLDQSIVESRNKLKGFPVNPPNSQNGLLCNFCANECRIEEGKIGFCGIRKNLNGTLIGGGGNDALVHAYYDQNPTNCCANWVCPAGTGVGFPKFCVSQNGETKTLNYSVFFLWM